MTDSSTGLIGWRAPSAIINTGDEAMDSLQNEDEVVWPKQTKRTQALRHVGERTDRDPALLTCNGACGKPHVRWTWHYMVNSSMFKCDACGTTRKWGLGF